MKVLLIEPFGHREGHFSVYPSYLSQALADSGQDVSVLTFDGVIGDWIKKDARIIHSSVCNKARLFAPALRLVNRTLFFIMPLRPFAWGLECFLTYLTALLQSREMRYDVVHILDTSAQSLFFLTFASTARDCGIVCTLHGTSKRQDLQNWGEKLVEGLRRLNYLRFFYLLSLKVSESQLVGSIWKWVYKRASTRNRLAFICMSKDTEKTYSHTPFHSNIFCIPDARPNPPLMTQQEARRHLGLPAGKPIFLSFGINHVMKNFEVVFRMAKDLHHDFILLFAGKILRDDIRVNDPERLARENGLQDKTIIINRHISDEEMPYFFCAADALLLSYRDAPMDISGGFSYACQCGLPSISVCGGQMGELVNSQNLGFTFVPGIASSLREAVANFLTLDKEDREAMRERILDYASSSDLWEQMKTGYLDVYRSLLRK